MGIAAILYSHNAEDLAQLVFPSRAAFAMMERDGLISGYKLMGWTFGYPGYFNGNGIVVDSEGDGVCCLSTLDSGNMRLSLDAKRCCLNPIISLDEAYEQIDRVAKARGLKAQQVRYIVEARRNDKSGMEIGEAKVNVKEINIALDTMKRQYISRPTNHEGRRGFKNREP